MAKKEKVILLNDKSIEELEQIKKNVINAYIVKNSRIRFVEIINDAFAILKWVGLKAFILPRNIIGIKDETYRMIGAIVNATSIIGEALTSNWLDKNDVDKKTVDNMVDAIDQIIYDKMGDEIFSSDNSEYKEENNLKENDVDNSL